MIDFPSENAMLSAPRMTQVEGLDRAELLKQNSMFPSLSPGELASIVSFTTRETEAADTVVFRRGDPDNVLYIIVSGDVKVFFGSVFLTDRLQARYRPSGGRRVRLPLYALAVLLALVYGLLVIGG